MKKFILLFVLLTLVQINDVIAQCAMCRSTLENNYSNGDPGIGAGINTGILYLLVMPWGYVFKQYVVAQTYFPTYPIVLFPMQYPHNSTPKQSFRVYTAIPCCRYAMCTSSEWHRRLSP